MTKDSRVWGQAEGECLIRIAPADEVSMTDSGGDHLHNDFVVCQRGQRHLLKSPLPLAILGWATDNRLRLNLFAGWHVVIIFRGVQDDEFPVRPEGEQENKTFPSQLTLLC